MNNINNEESSMDLHEYLDNIRKSIIDSQGLNASHSLVNGGIVGDGIKAEIDINTNYMNDVKTFKRNFTFKQIDQEIDEHMTNKIGNYFNVDLFDYKVYEKPCDKWSLEC